MYISTKKSNKKRGIASVGTFFHLEQTLSMDLKNSFKKTHLKLDEIMKFIQYD